jgi:hypothetical protein
MITTEIQRHAGLFPSGTDAAIDQIDKMIDPKLAKQLRAKGLKRVKNNNGQFEVTFAQAASHKAGSSTVAHDAVVTFDYSESNGVISLRSIKGVRATWNSFSARIVSVDLTPVGNGNTYVTATASFFGAPVPIAVELDAKGKAVKKP